MKILYYNHIEMPAEVRLESKVLGVKKQYQCDAPSGPVDMDELFRLASTDTFGTVDVLLTSHNEAYYRKTKESAQKEVVDGWVSLKEYKNGGGYLNDKARVLL